MDLFRLAQQAVAATRYDWRASAETMNVLKDCKLADESGPLWFFPYNQPTADVVHRWIEANWPDAMALRRPLDVLTSPSLFTSGVPKPAVPCRLDDLPIEEQMAGEMYMACQAEADEAGEAETEDDDKDFDAWVAREIARKKAELDASRGTPHRATQRRAKQDERGDIEPHGDPEQ